MNLTLLIPFFAVAVALVAAVTDGRERRIPNLLTYSAMLSGILLQAVVHGWRGMLQGVSGGLLFGGVFMLFYVIRTMGAGDVKLAAALGCIVGPSAAMQLMFTTALAGGVLAIIFVIHSCRIVETLRNVLWVAGFHAQYGLRTHPVLNLDNPTATRMPYGLAFAAGTLYWAIFLQIWR